MDEAPWTFVGQRVGPDALGLIKTIVSAYAGLSRDGLAATVCEVLGWTRSARRSNR